jgi:malonyl-CoA/methylmalonyl-CoA synthetase
MPELSLIRRARLHGQRPAVEAGRSFTYEELLESSERVASFLLAGRTDLREAPIAFLVPPSFDYVAVQWGIWRAGGIAVPLAPSYPVPELRYVVEDADASLVVTHPDFEDAASEAVGGGGERGLVSTERLRVEATMPLPDVTPERRGMILYTSGTTGKPKGVVTTHANIEAQVTSLVEAWQWSADDHALLALPLHHVHGIINVVTCALWAGARCEMLPAFDAATVWKRFRDSPVTVFMAVPTMYHRLIAEWDRAEPGRRKALSDACRRMRLMVSGSAPLPTQTLERWHEISGHLLLERYGMTEIGMGLSNPLTGERVPGHVGTPLPGVEVRLLDETGDEAGAGSPGEIHVRGPGVFTEYWRRPDETREVLRDGWFATGDVAVVEDGNYRILGRTSVDIIKTGGFKVSALEIEEVLRRHPDIDDCAVVGVADEDLGERVCVAAELRKGSALAADGLRAWAKQYLAPYKVPRDFSVTTLPRNALGKVQKQDLAILFGAP